MLKRLLPNLIVQRNEAVIPDMEAGFEHLGRGTADFVDSFIVVIEPGKRSEQAVDEIRQIKAEIDSRTG